MDGQDRQDGDRIFTLTRSLSLDGRGGFTLTLALCHRGRGEFTLTVAFCRRGSGEFTLTLALCHRGRGDIMGSGLGLDASFDCEQLQPERFVAARFGAVIPCKSYGPASHPQLLHHCPH